MRLMAKKLVLESMEGVGGHEVGGAVQHELATHGRHESQETLLVFLGSLIDGSQRA